MRRLSFAISLALCLPGAAFATCGGSFSGFVEDLKAEAITRGHSRASVSEFFASVTQDDRTLRERFAQDGYLFLKKAVATAHCDALLQDLLNVLSPYVDFDPAQNKPVLTGEPFYETDSVWDEVYPRVQKLESFHRFFHQPWMLVSMDSQLPPTAWRTPAS